MDKNKNVVTSKKSQKQAKRKKFKNKNLKVNQKNKIKSNDNLKDQKITINEEILINDILKKEKDNPKEEVKEIKESDEKLNSEANYDDFLFDSEIEDLELAEKLLSKNEDNLEINKNLTSDFKNDFTKEEFSDVDSSPSISDEKLIKKESLLERIESDEDIISLDKINNNKAKTLLDEIDDLEKTNDKPILNSIELINEIDNRLNTEKEFNKTKNEKSSKANKIKNTIIIILLICFLICLAISTFKIINWFIDNHKVDDIADDLTKEVKEVPSDNAENINPPEDKADDYWDYIKMDMLSVSFDDLIKKNKDTVGWIKVNGTNINYPFVQTTNNDYYLTHAYDGSYNDAGWIFADYRNDMINFNRNTIIYGHGRLNKSMFGSLKNILNSDWFDNKDNYIVKLSTPYENTLWQVFSVYSIKAESYYITTDFINDNDYLKFLNTMKSRSNFAFSANVGVNDKILTLSTCLNDNGYRVVMHAKLIKREARN